MTANKTAEVDYQSLSAAFFDALLEAATEACGSPWQIVAEPGPDLPQDGTEPIWVRLILDGSMRGELWIEFRRDEALVFASKLLGETGSEFGSTQSEALLNVIKAATEKFRSTLGQEYGTFTIDARLAAETLTDRASTSQILAGDSDGSRITIRMHLNQALMDGLFLLSRVGSTSQNIWQSGAAREGKMNPEHVNLDLVMDVELNVTLRFGQRQLTLREVLELTSGSVVELDRQVEEPVELILDGVVVARGEAVVIDGNYGLRVTEVSHPVSSTIPRMAQ